MSRTIVRPQVPAPFPPKLERCPFCDGDAYTESGDGKYFVGCRDCYCNVGEAYDRSAMPEHMFASEDDAIAAWNKRSTPAIGAIRAAAFEQAAKAAESYVGRKRPLSLRPLSAMARGIARSIRAMKQEGHAPVSATAESGSHSP